MLWVTGAGDARFFALSGGAYVSPAEDFGRLVKNGDGTFTYTAKDQTRENFNAAGLLTSVVDAHGLTLRSYLYDGQNRLTRVTALDGGQATLSYDPTSGLLNGISEPGGRSLSVQHTGSDLTQLTDVDQTTRTLGYDTAHHLTSDQWAPLSAAFGYDPSTGLPNSVNRGLGTTYAIASAASTQTVQPSAAHAGSSTGRRETEAQRRLCARRYAAAQITCPDPCGRVRS